MGKNAPCVSSVSIHLRDINFYALYGATCTVQRAEQWRNRELFEAKVICSKAPRKGSWMVQSIRMVVAMGPRVLDTSERRSLVSLCKHRSSTKELVHGSCQWLTAITVPGSRATWEVAGAESLGPFRRQHWQRPLPCFVIGFKVGLWRIPRALCCHTGWYQGLYSVPERRHRPKPPRLPIFISDLNNLGTHLSMAKRLFLSSPISSPPAVARGFGNSTGITAGRSSVDRADQDRDSHAWLGGVVGNTNPGGTREIG